MTQRKLIITEIAKDSYEIDNLGFSNTELVGIFSFHGNPKIRNFFRSSEVVEKAAVEVEEE